MNRNLWLIGVSSLLLALSACTRQEAGSQGTPTDDTGAPASETTPEQPGATTDYGSESTPESDPNAMPPSDTTTTPPPPDQGQSGTESGTTTPPQ
jgi:hypothetical protein